MPCGRAHGGAPLTDRMVSAESNPGDAELEIAVRLVEVILRLQNEKAAAEKAKGTGARLPAQTPPRARDGLNLRNLFSGRETKLFCNQICEHDRDREYYAELK